MCGSNTNDTSPDVFWQSDTPMAGQASANNTITAANARSTAVLNVPAGATVTHAYLYWSARSTGAAGDMAVTLDGPGGFNGMVTAADSITTGFGGTYYQSAADITSIVQMRGNGAYRVSGVDSAALTNLNDAQISAGWWMVVLYELPGDKLRTIAVARITMPASMVRLSAGREEMSEEMQALCFLAGANSIFYGEKLLTTPNPGADEDLALLKDPGVPADRFDRRRSLLGQFDHWAFSDEVGV